MLLSLGGMAFAQLCTEEVEPNDTPMNATLLGLGIVSGPSSDHTRCFTGDMPAGDQDMFEWVVTEEDALRRWVLAVEGAPGRLTALELYSIRFASDGSGVAQATNLLRAAAQGSAEARSRSFLIAPGRYHLAMSASGGQGAYVGMLLGQGEIRRGALALGDRSPLHAFVAYGPVEAQARQTFRIDEEGAGRLWTVEAEVALGDSLTVRLLGPSGAVLGEATTGADGMALMPHRSLEVGEHQIELIGSAGQTSVALRDLGMRTQGQEIEPNNNIAQANHFPMDQAMRGSLDGDEDIFRLVVDRPGSWDLHLQATAATTLRLLDGAERTLFTRSGGPASYGPLHLQPGTYFISMRGDRGVGYELRWQAAESAREGYEREPNDTVMAATPMGEDGRVRGSLDAGDHDVYRFDVVGEAQLFRIQLVGDGVERLAVLHRGGGTQVEVRGERRLRIDDLLLLPGDHYLRVQGGGAAYALQVIPLGPAPLGGEVGATPAADEPLRATGPGPMAGADEGDMDAVLPPSPPPPPGRLEIEPNDDASRAIRLMPGQVHVGRFGHPADVDIFRFHLKEDQRIRLELVAPEGEPSIRMLIAGSWHDVFDPDSGEPNVVERWMLAGDHTVTLRADRAVSGGYYQLRLHLLGRLGSPVDLEPNNSRLTAGRMPTDLRWSGMVGGWHGDDVFVLPSFSEPTRMDLRMVAGDRLQVALLDDGATTSVSWVDGVASLTVPGDVPAWLRLRGNGEYEVEVTFASPPDPAELRPRGDGGLRLELDMTDLGVAAYWHLGQTLAAELIVENTAAEPHTLRFDGSVTDARAEVLLPDQREIGPGETLRLPVTFHLPPDLPESQPVVLEVSASTDQEQVVAGMSAWPACDASPVGARPHPLVHTVLLGRLDLLWSGLGGRVVGDAASARMNSLLRGRVNLTTGMRFELQQEAVVYELAGGRSHRLVGAVLNPTSDGAVSDQLRAFRIDLSLDGQTFTPVMEAELRAARVDQSFVFDAPVEARYARLVPLSSQGGGSSAYLGAWSLLAEDPAPLGALNLADPGLGGHVLWTSVPVVGIGASMLTRAQDVRAVDLIGAEAFRFVVGLHHGRAAQVTELVWLDRPALERPSGVSFEQVTVEVSVDGPSGPWSELGTWWLGQPNGEARWLLDDPVWARYLRFTAPKVEGERQHWPPETLEVWERPADEGYATALGAWGTEDGRGVFEWSQFQQGLTAPAVSTESSGDDRREGANLLLPGQSAIGTVLVGEDVDWYRIPMTEGHSYMEISLRGQPTIEFRYRLEDASGQPVAYELATDGDGHTLRFFGDPGDYFLRLEEPPRSVVFAWDTSGSVHPYLDTTYAALSSFALGLDGEREAAQLLAFDSPMPRWLLPSWSFDPARVQRSIVEFGRDADSSNAERALLVATQALSQREGTKAVFLITDAVSSAEGLNPELWWALDEVRPRVFSFEVSSNGSAWTQDKMQGWAAVAGGFYDLSRGVGGFDDGFTRAACLLRRPKGYEVEALTEARALPGPGRLIVAQADGLANSPVHVIFDASGSMGRALPSGEPRIDAAKRALEHLVLEALPDGTPFSLRAFGHITPSSCESRLDLPRSVLDRDRALQVVRGIEPKLLSQTPLADALLAAEDDLSQTMGQRTVILITDGVESCGGDPAAAVTALRAGGPLSLAIVSLGLAEDDLAVFRALAREVGASYVDVTDFESLRDSVLAALYPAFEVLGPDGAVIATGRVGDEGVELPMGVYSVRMAGAPDIAFRDVRVVGERTLSLMLGAP